MSGTNRPQRMAKAAVQKLEGYIRSGLPRSYQGDPSFDSMLCDFYPDLPWERDQLSEALAFLNQDPACQDTARRFQEKFDFDLSKEWQDAKEGRAD